MMDAFRSWCETILRIPPDPEPPSGDETTSRVFRAAPAYFRLLLILWAISNVFILFFFVTAFGVAGVVALVDLQRKPGTGAAAAVVAFGLALVGFIVVFQAVFRLAVMRLNFEKRWYVVTDRSLRVREGLVIVREMTVSFANIQDVAVTQGPIERMLGLSNIRVTTAGGGGGPH
jgi:membrane protein YdbS with pleckstrin-like domain